MQREEPGDRTAWLALREIAARGRDVRQLLEVADSAASIVAASAARRRAMGVPSDWCEALVSFTDWEGVREEARRIAAAGARLVVWTDPDYPGRLREIAFPPPALTVRGELGDGSQPAVAVVGSRRPTAYGREMARRLAAELAALGITVVSGLARGIDGEAHRAACEAGGRTVAVLGCGCDVIYPAEHRSLAEDVCRCGALVSELRMGTRPLAHHFPARNRLISGMSLGVVVVEAAERSGSLITARHALEQAREVFAVPGPAQSPAHRGSNSLIQQGAKLVEYVEDIIQELAAQLGAIAYQAAPAPDPEPRAARLRMAFREPVAHIDALIERSGLTAAEVSEILVGWEVDGSVTRLPGNHFALRGRAPGA